MKRNRKKPHSLSNSWHRISPPTITLITSLLIFSQPGKAEPNITGVSYFPSEKLLHISGSDFGADIQFALLDTVESAKFSVIGKEVRTYSYDELWIDYGTEWAKPLVPRSSIDILDEPRNVIYYGGLGRTNNSWLNPLDSIETDSIFVSWLYKPTKDPSANGGSNKFIRIWDDKSGKKTRISWTQMHLTYGAGDIAGSEGTSWASWPGNINHWNLNEIYVNSEKGFLRTWTNGQLVHDVNNFVKSPVQTGFNVRLLGFDPSYSDPYADMEVFIDDIYVSNSPAKAILSESGNWNQASMSSSYILLPVEWNPESIKVEFDLDSYGKAIYLYIVNDNREVNSKGYLVCSKCPMSTPLTVK